VTPLAERPERLHRPHVLHSAILGCLRLHDVRLSRVEPLLEQAAASPLGPIAIRAEGPGAMTVTVDSQSPYRRV